MKPQDSQRGRRPSPINDVAPLSSFHTKTDGLKGKTRAEMQSETVSKRGGGDEDAADCMSMREWH